MFERYVGGVPKKAFTSNAYGIVTGKSGQDILYNNVNSRIEIYQDRFHCFAFMDDGYFRLALETTNRKNNELHKSPDLFALLFAEAAHEKFLERGLPIIGFKAFWIRSSDNFTEFDANVKNGMTEADAARSTWSGRLAEKLKYSNAEVIHDIPDENITVLFT